MLDHLFLSLSDLDRSIAFYTAALAPPGIVTRLDYDGKDPLPTSAMAATARFDVK